jgi:hypothetical protein
VGQGGGQRRAEGREEGKEVKELRNACGSLDVATNMSYGGRGGGVGGQ